MTALSRHCHEDWKGGLDWGIFGAEFQAWVYYESVQPARGAAELEVDYWKQSLGRTR